MIKQGCVEKNLTLPPKAVIHKNLDYTEAKRILIAGSGSYIGEKFKDYMLGFDNYVIDSFSTMSREWERMDFSAYDVVYYVAGIAHV